MRRSEYNRLTEREWKGKKVITVKELINGKYIIPVGTVMTVDRKHGGFGLISKPCNKCGVKIVINKVPPEAVDLKIGG